MLPQQAAKSKMIHQTMQALLRREDDPGSTYPDSWYPLQAEALAAGYLLSSPDQIRKFLKNYRDELSGESARMLRGLLSCPMQWTAYRVIRREGGGFLYIEDLLEETEEPMLLYSPGTSNILRSSVDQDVTFIALLFFNGSCWQTSGIIHNYASVKTDDILYYCNGLDADEFASGGLTGVINRHFIDFFSLDDVSTIPPIKFRKQRGYLLWREFQLMGIGDTQLPGVWEIDSSDSGILRMTYEGPDEELASAPPLECQDPEDPWERMSMFTPYIYIDPDTDELCITASTMHDYQILVSALSCRFDLGNSEQTWPTYRISPTVYATSLKLPRFHIPWHRFSEDFDAADTQEAEDPSLEKFNRLLREVNEARHYGTTVDIAKRCSDLGIDQESFEQVLSKGDEMAERNHPSLEFTPEDRAFELNDFPVPPPASRRAFFFPLFMSEIFILDESFRTLDLVAEYSGETVASQVFSSGIGEYFTDLFETAFSTMGPMVMNYTFYILVYHSDQQIFVRSLAIEILKLHHHHLVLTGMYESAEKFIEAYSKFILRGLCTKGLLEVEQRPKGQPKSQGLYRIKPSPLFRAFISLQPGW